MTVAWTDIFTGVAVLLLAAVVLGAFKFVAALSQGQQKIASVVSEGFAEVKMSHAEMCGSLRTMCEQLEAHATLDDTRFKNVDDKIASVPCKQDSR